VDALGWKGVYFFFVVCFRGGDFGDIEWLLVDWGAIGERCNALHDKKFTNEEQQNIVAKLF